MAKRKRQQSDFEEYERSRSNKTFYEQLNQVGMENPGSGISASAPNIQQSQVDFGTVTSGGFSNFMGDNQTSIIADMLTDSAEIGAAAVAAKQTYGKVKDNDNLDILSKEIFKIDERTDIVESEKLLLKEAKYSEYKKKMYLRSNKRNLKALRRQDKLKYPGVLFSEIETDFDNKVSHIESYEYYTEEDRLAAYEEVGDDLREKLLQFEGNKTLEPQVEKLRFKVDGLKSRSDRRLQNEDLRLLRADLEAERETLRIESARSGEAIPADALEQFQKRAQMKLKAFDEKHPILSKTDEAAFRALEISVKSFDATGSRTLINQGVSDWEVEFRSDVDEVNSILDETERMEALDKLIDEGLADLETYPNLSERQRNAAIQKIIGPQRRQLASLERNFVKDLLGQFGTKWSQYADEFIDWRLNLEGGSLPFDYNDSSTVYSEFENWLAVEKGVPLFDEDDIDLAMSERIQEVFQPELDKRLDAAKKKIKAVDDQQKYTYALDNLRTEVSGVETALGEPERATAPERYEAIGDVANRFKDFYDAASEAGSTMKGDIVIQEQLTNLVQELTLHDVDTDPRNPQESFVTNLNLMLEELEEAGFSEEYTKNLREKVLEVVNFEQPRSERDIQFLETNMNPVKVDSTTGNVTFNYGVFRTQLKRYFNLPGMQRPGMAEELIQNVDTAIGSVMERDFVRAGINLGRIPGIDKLPPSEQAALLKDLEAAVVDILFESRETETTPADSILRLEDRLKEGKIELSPESAQQLAMQVGVFISSPMVGPLIDLRSAIEQAADPAGISNPFDNSKVLAALDAVRDDFLDKKTYPTSGPTSGQFTLTAPLTPLETMHDILGKPEDFNKQAPLMLGLTEVSETLATPGTVAQVGKGIDVIFDRLFLPFSGAQGPVIDESNEALSFMDILETSNLTANNKRKRVSALLQEMFPSYIISAEDSREIAAELIDVKNDPGKMNVLKARLKRKYQDGFISAGFQDTVFSTISTNDVVYAGLTTDEKGLDGKLASQPITIGTLNSVFGGDRDLSYSILLSLREKEITRPTVLDIKQIIEDSGFVIYTIKGPVKSNGQAETLFRVKPQSSVDWTEQAIWSAGRNQVDGIDYAVDNNYYPSEDKEKTWIPDYLDTLVEEGVSELQINAIDTLLSIPMTPELEELPNRVELYRMGRRSFDYVLDYIKESTKQSDEFCRTLATFSVFAINDGRLNVNNFALLDYYVKERQGKIPLQDNMYKRDLEIKVTPRLREGSVGFDFVDTVNKRTEIVRLPFMYEGQRGSANPFRPFELDFDKIPSRIPNVTERRLNTLELERIIFFDGVIPAKYQGDEGLVKFAELIKNRDSLSFTD